MDAKQYIPYAVNFAPNTESASGLLEIPEFQRNYDATKFTVNQSGGSIALQLVSTTYQELRLDVHLGEGSLVGGSWNAVLSLEAASPTERVVASETVVVPIPTSASNLHFRVFGAVGYTARTQDFAVVNCYPLPGVENLG